MDPSERKAWEKAQRTERLVDIAQAVFFENGYKASTMDQIATEAGYKKRTLYLYFKDKEELFLAVVLRGLKLLNSMLRDAWASSPPGSDRLRAMGKAFFDFSLTHPDYADLIMIYEAQTCIYYGKASDGAARIPSTEDFSEDLRGACQAVTDADAELVARAIAEGMAEGSIRGDMTPRQVLLIVWGQIFGVLKILQMRRDFFNDAFGIDREALFDRFLEMAEKGLVP